MKAKILLAITLVGNGFTSAATLRYQGYAFTIRGNVESKSIRSSTNGSFYYDIVTNHFELQTIDCRWLIKLGTRDSKVFDYRIVSSDGSSTFLLFSYETRQKMNLREGKTPLVNVGDGTVTSGNIPRFGSAEEAGAVWIAYGSWCHFAEDPYSRRRPVPFATYVSAQPLQPGEPLVLENASWQLSASPPHLPKTLAYYVENGPNHGPAVGFTNVVYEALSFDTFEGLNLPKESVVSIYRSHPMRSNNPTNQLCRQMRIFATNMISGVELESFKPKLPGTTVIREERFNNGTGLSFAYLTDDHWPSEPVSRNSDAYKEAKAELSGTMEDFLPDGTNAPDIRILSLEEEKEKQISDYIGKVVVLEFWATWCPPCQTAMAELQTYKNKYKHWDDSVALLTLSLDENRERAASHVKRKGWNQTENFWSSREGARKYSFTGIPMVYIIDQQGKVAAAGHELDIPKAVNGLLSEDRQRF